MNISESTEPVIPNGSGAAAMLAAAVGSLALAAIAFAGDKSGPIRNSLNFLQTDGAALRCDDGRYSRLVPCVGTTGVALGKVNRRHEPNQSSISCAADPQHSAHLPSNR